MRENLEHMLVNIKKDLIFMANEVENALHCSLKSLENQDKDLAKLVTKSDKNINVAEVKIEKQIVSLLALQQPVAADLRFMLAAIKINNDLERIGDHSKNIAKSAKKLCGEPIMKPIDEIIQLGKECKNMLRESVQAFINQNTDIAQDVHQRDKHIDEIHDKIFNDIIINLEENKGNIRQGVELISVIKQLERIADLSINICEDVIFMKDAKITRYGFDKKESGK
ncbi:MAG: phosphate signaling complex protein PhoU [Bacteroidetes bacterium]|nr:phosphate signaling complex protein PhoU [Bacteroidota bacterium]